MPNWASQCFALHLHIQDCHFQSHMEGLTFGGKVNAVHQYVSHTQTPLQPWNWVWRI